MAAMASAEVVSFVSDMMFPVIGISAITPMVILQPI
jgi:hypothetical protein